jgi:signal transduction histidine kinase
MTAIGDTFREQLESLYAISVEIAALRELSQVYDRALSYSLELTESKMGFIDLINEGRVDMDVVAVKGFQPSDPQFYERFRRMPARPNVFGVVITEERPNISNDVENDPLRVGIPPGHPLVRTFLGVPLRVGTNVIGMVGVCNKSGGYGADDERLLGTFANQVAVAIDNARLYELQREMIDRLLQLNRRLSDAERDQLLSLERERIAGALHDRIEQHIFTIGLQLSGLLDNGMDDDTEAKLRDTRHLAARTADEVREVIFALATPDGDGGGGLAAAVRRRLGEIERRAGLETDLVVTGAPATGAETVEATLEAVIKEALANVVKHAEAHTVLVTIRYEGDQITVVVQDDGVGAAEQILRRDEQSYLHYGMRNMRQQIMALGGTFEIVNGDESGLTVRATVPLRPQSS